MELQEGWSRCRGCHHYRRDGSPFATCDAFPAGIPPAVLCGAGGHGGVHPGDHGIRYLPVGQPEAPADRPRH